MTIYDALDDISALRNLIESLTDEETGETRELNDDEKAQFIAWCAETEDAFKDKFDKICKVYKNMRASANVCTEEKDALKAEYDRLSKRSKSKEAEADRMKGLIWFALDKLHKKKFKTDLFSAEIQNTQYSVKCQNAGSLPFDFQKIEANNSAIKEAVSKGELYTKDEPQFYSKLFFKDENLKEFELIGVAYTQGSTIVIR
jgi:hypothetical protein